jgi:thiol-disulfide isomerase/thioredoxin
MLYFFYGEECPHCHEMMPVVDKLIAEGTRITKLETWRIEENAKKLEGVDKGRCGGVPFFYNDENDQFICGSTSEENVRKWAKGEG